MTTIGGSRGRIGLQAAAGGLVACAGVLAVLLCRMPVVHADTNGTTDALKLQLEVDALSTLQDLQLTPAQLSALQDLSSDTAATLPDTPLKLEAAHVAALQTLRAALISGKEDQIDDAQDKVGEFEEQQDAEDAPDIEPTDAARGKVGMAIKLLTARQLAGYISENAEDVADPAEIVVEALNQCHDMTDDDYQSLKDDTAADLSQLAGGFNPAKTPTVVGKANHLLDRARHLSAEDFKTQLPALQDEARKIGNGIDPMSCLRHWFEGEMADLLSNPQLSQALADRGATTKPAEQ